MSEPKNEPSTSTDVPLTAAELDAATVTLQALERFDEDLTDETGMWVFGYGSLCWLQGFTFDKSLTGYIRGYSRKFWQGNTTHRGTREKPGRVVTLVEEENVSSGNSNSVQFRAVEAKPMMERLSLPFRRTLMLVYHPDVLSRLPSAVVWGQAFQVREKEAFSYLNNRECELGGYLTTIATFYPRQTGKEDKPAKPFPAILYIATPSNELWMGDSPAEEIANNIVECSGNSGHNVEYLLKLASFVHENIPEAVDDHLFTLERLVLSEIEKRKLCLRTLMGERKLGKPEGGSGEADAGQQDQEAAGRGRTDAFQFTSTVPSKQLRCVNI